MGEVARPLVVLVEGFVLQSLADLPEGDPLSAWYHGGQPGVVPSLGEAPDDLLRVPAEGLAELLHSAAPFLREALFLVIECADDPAQIPVLQQLGAFLPQQDRQIGAALHERPGHGRRGEEVPGDKGVEQLADQLPVVGVPCLQEAVGVKGLSFPRIAAPLPEALQKLENLGQIGVNRLL